MWIQSRIQPNLIVWIDNPWQFNSKIWKALT